MLFCVSVVFLVFDEPHSIVQTDIFYPVTSGWTVELFKLGGEYEWNAIKFLL